MTLYRITISYKPYKCRDFRWIKGFVLANNESEALKKFKNEIGEERYNRGKVKIETIEENSVYIYRHDF